MKLRQQNLVVLEKSTTTILVFFLLLSTINGAEGSRQLKDEIQSQPSITSAQQIFNVNDAEAANLERLNSSSTVEYQAYSGPSQRGSGH
nr:hypothetical protein Iba_scaffold24108CG0010 [Ipomoea batatas]